ncbi:hypothetical protein K1719_003239 [Acacia pycnantha]|nr:hypothetical protein K1719_003239 [Acacia pycnantha]
MDLFRASQSFQQIKPNTLDHLACPMLRRVNRDGHDPNPPPHFHGKTLRIILRFSHSLIGNPTSSPNQSRWAIQETLH